MAERRRVALWAASVLTAAGMAAAWRMEAEPEPVARRSGTREAPRAGARGAAASGARTTPSAVLALDRLPREPFDVAAVEEIARAWEPPPPPAPARPALTDKPVPQAPPLPFRYIGLAVEDGGSTVFVQAGQEIHLLRVGQTVRGQYRVEAINEREVRMTYLPLKIPQTLALGGAP